MENELHFDVCCHGYFVEYFDEGYEGLHVIKTALHKKHGGYSEKYGGCSQTRLRLSLRKAQ